jgi:hypothetical protein
MVAKREASWSYLQFHQRETPTSPHAAVVFDCGAADDGAEFVDGTRRDSSGLDETGGAAAGFATGLGDEGLEMSKGWD